MRKAFALILAMVLVISLATPAFAATCMGLSKPHAAKEMDKGCTGAVSQTGGARCGDICWVTYMYFKTLHTCSTCARSLKSGDHFEYRTHDNCGYGDTVVCRY